MNNRLRRAAAVSPLFGALVLAPLLFMTQSGAGGCGGGGGGGGGGGILDPKETCTVRAGTVTLPMTQRVVESMLDLPFSFSDGRTWVFRRSPSGLVIENRFQGDVINLPLVVDAQGCHYTVGPISKPCGTFRLTVPDVTVEEGEVKKVGTSMVWVLDPATSNATPVDMNVRMDPAQLMLWTPTGKAQPLFAATCGQALTGSVGG